MSNDSKLGKHEKEKVNATHVPDLRDVRKVQSKAAASRNHNRNQTLPIRATANNSKVRGLLKDLLE